MNWKILSMRASAYINLYENMITGKVIMHPSVIKVYTRKFAKETEELNLKFITTTMLMIFIGN